MEGYDQGDRFCLNLIDYRTFMIKFLFPLIFFFFHFSLHSDLAETDSFISLTGYLGKKELASAIQTVLELENKPTKTLILEINSNSGDLNQVLKLAKIIYALKISQHLKVIAYLNDNVLGPAALLPFLADELYCSLFVSWGDIPLGTEGALPSNILRNQVRSLINSQNAKTPLLYVLADAMSDSSLRVIDQQGSWSIANKEEDLKYPPITASGQTLVINHEQLKTLGLVIKVLAQSEFYSLFHLHAKEGEKKEILPAAISKLDSLEKEEKLKKYIKFNPNGSNLVGHIYIGGHENSINESTWLYVKKALDYYKDKQPIFIILELNTPGGEVFAAQKIADALKEIDIQNDIPIIAFINNWAISAGAMLAYSCRFIATIKDGNMGAAEPVYVGTEGKLETASEKVNSALRADFASKAQFFDRDPLIAENMVDKDMVLVFRHGSVVKLENESQIRLTGPNPDTVIATKGKLLTLNAEGMLKYGVADFVLNPGKMGDITSVEKGQGQWPLSKTAFDSDPYFKNIPNSFVDSYQMDWKTRFFVLLATPLVSSILFMGLLVGAYMEFSSPGLTFPGIVALVSLFLIILSSFALELANWLELIFLLTGVAVILVELFVLPTFGLLGILGILLFFIGLFGMLLPGFQYVHFDYDTNSLNAAGQFFLERLAWLCGTLIISVVTIFLLARYCIPSFAGYSRFILRGSEQNGYIAGEEPKDLPQPGEKGEVLSTLRPAGKILVNERIYDAISRGDFIEAGEKVVVAELEGSTIIVQKESI